MPEEHACSTLPRPEKLKDRGITTAMGRLKAWGAQRKDKQPVQGFRKIPVSDPSQSPPKETNALTRIISPFTAARMKKSQAAFLTSTNTLKKNAKGDDKIPREKRVYVHLEAVAEGEGHAGAKIPRADAFYSAEWSVGKVLDAAAKMLTVINVNNRGGGEEQKLRVFSVETGRLLEFSEKLGSVTKTGDTLVLLRGVGQTDVP
ncbi:MAG: hypothetical protein M1828_006002 [Chrysothrix sp. TS-e1954]|nr:MAG: hypothetical protein M1828_006002 [Chrysothrix sp. TS-e1954]